MSDSDRFNIEDIEKITNAENKLFGPKLELDSDIKLWYKYYNGPMSFGYKQENVIHPRTIQENSRFAVRVFTPYTIERLKEPVYYEAYDSSDQLARYRLWGAWEAWAPGGRATGASTASIRDWSNFWNISEAQKDINKQQDYIVEPLWTEGLTLSVSELLRTNSDNYVNQNWLTIMNINNEKLKNKDSKKSINEIKNFYLSTSKNCNDNFIDYGGFGQKFEISQQILIRDTQKYIKYIFENKKNPDIQTKIFKLLNINLIKGNNLDTRKLHYSLNKDIFNDKISFILDNIEEIPKTNIKCFACGCVIKLGEGECDHLLPITQAYISLGINNNDSIRAEFSYLHKKCNGHKSDMTIYQFKKAINDNEFDDFYSPEEHSPRLSKQERIEIINKRLRAMTFSTYETQVNRIKLIEKYKKVQKCRDNIISSKLENNKNNEISQLSIILLYFYISGKILVNNDQIQKLYNQLTSNLRENNALINLQRNVIEIEEKKTQIDQQLIKELKLRDKVWKSQSENISKRGRRYSPYKFGKLKLNKLKLLAKRYSLKMNKSLLKNLKEIYKLQKLAKKKKIKITKKVRGKRVYKNKTQLIKDLKNNKKKKY